MVGHRAMGACLHLEGRFASAQEHFERALRLYRPEVHQQMAAVAAQDMRAAALSYLARVQLILGFPERGRASIDASLRWARELGHPLEEMRALAGLAYFHIIARSEATAVAPLEEMRALAAKQKFPFWLALANVLRGHTAAVGGACGDGLAMAREGFDTLRRIGSPYNQSHGLAVLANCRAMTGEMDEALALSRRGLEVAERLGEHWFEAELHRLRGEWLFSVGRADEARAALDRALALARSQEAKLWELRASTSLARLWRDQGKRTEARDLLTPIYDWFTEGFDTLDLKQAKALLDELAVGR
jgi:predicted ATPase